MTVWSANNFYFDERVRGIGPGIYFDTEAITEEVITGISGTLLNFPIVGRSVSLTNGTQTYVDDGNGILTSSLSPSSGTINYASGAWSVSGWEGSGAESASYIAVTNIPANVNIHWDQVAYPTIIGLEDIYPVADRYIASEVGGLKDKSKWTGIEEYSQYVDLLQLVPAKFRSSIALQQLLYVFGLEVGTWIGEITDLQTLLDKWNVDQEYIQYLADLVGYSMVITPTTTFADMQQQLLQVIDWYKQKGTYQALQVIAYTIGLNISIWDLYTKDYINFVQEPWYTGLEGTNPPGLDSNYYKSPHFGLEVDLIQVYNFSNNFLYNWSFDSWSAGPNAAPDGWVFNTTGFGDVSQNAIYTQDSIYSAQITGISGENYIAQSLQNRNGIGYWINTTVTLGCWVLSDSNQAFLQIADGVSGNAVYHPGDAQWHFLTVTYNVSGSAVDLTLICGISSGAHIAYFDGAVLLRGPQITPIPSPTVTYPGPDLWYLFDGANTYNTIITYVERVRPVNTVPYYSLLLVCETAQNGIDILLPGEIQTATTSVWTFNQYNFDVGGGTFNSSETFNSSQTFNAGEFFFDDGFYFDFSSDSFYNSITKWVLGNGSKGVSPGQAGFAIQSPIPGLSGTLPPPTIYNDHVEWSILVPNNITQSGISELGLYFSDGVTLEVASTFPNINIVPGLQLKILVEVYYNYIPIISIADWDSPGILWDESNVLWD